MSFVIFSVSTEPRIRLPSGDTRMPLKLKSRRKREMGSVSTPAPSTDTGVCGVLSHKLQQLQSDRGVFCRCLGTIDGVDNAREEGKFNRIHARKMASSGSRGCVL